MAHIRRHPKSGRWQVRYRDPSGRERSATFGRRVDADRYAATVAADVVRGQYVDPQLGKATVAELAERWQQTRRHLAPATRAQDRHLLTGILRVFGSRSVSSVRRSEVAAWVSGLTVAPATAAKMMQKLSAVFALAVGDGALKSNPCDGVPRPSQASERTGRALADDEIQAVLDAAEQVDPSTAAMVWAMARAGLRIGEVLALRRGDIEGSTLHVRGSVGRDGSLRPVKGKNRDGRTIPIPTDLAARLSRHVAAQPVSSLEGWLFVAPRGGRLRYDNWRTRVWNRIVDAARIGDVRPHDLRHTMATRLFLADGWSVPQVQAYLGHVDPALTLRVYTHIASEQLPQPSGGHFADTIVHR